MALSWLRANLNDTLRIYPRTSRLLSRYDANARLLDFVAPAISGIGAHVSVCACLCASFAVIENNGPTRA